MNESEYVLNELSKGIKMGMESISTISEKLTEGEIKDDLLCQYNSYNSLLKKVNSQLEDNGLFPREVPPSKKMMTWIGIQTNTLTDKSNSHIADIMIQGYNMGIIEGHQLLNNNTDIDSKLKNTLKEFIMFQENSVEKLKSYL